MRWTLAPRSSTLRSTPSSRSIITAASSSSIPRRNRLSAARDAVRGQDIAETIIPERFREAHHRGLRRYLETGEARVLGKRIEVAALRANGEEFPVELAVVRVPNSDPPLFTAFLRDLTEQRRLEQRRSAVYNLAEALAEAESLDDAAQPLLRILATTFGASVGAFWAVEGDFLRCVHTYRTPSQPDDDFDRISRSMRFGPGDGLPGRVWQSPACTGSRICSRTTTCRACRRRSATACAPRSRFQSASATKCSRWSSSSVPA
jgi:PAS domain S-box-containing protein